MQWALGLLVLAMGCVGPVTEAADAGDTSGDFCESDDACGPGLVCEGCPENQRVCLPGCRATEQCPANLVCRLGVVACSTCPCAPGWCDLDPCRDVDHDGYVPKSDEAVACPGKLPGDCDDARASVHPGGVEVCGNGLDDDCNGARDTRDPECRVCAAGQRTCSWSLSCSTGQQCDHGCCVACPAVVPPTCDPGQCTLSLGIDPNTGCSLGWACHDCSSCTTPGSVCGLNGATYESACAAQVAGTAALYGGSCLRGEGLACLGGQCPTTHYCRDTCPSCDGPTEQRCTRKGFCVHDEDCAVAVTAVALCADGGIAPLGCEANRCVTRCP